jgi:tetratricopeptide (TPR) repeat protein
MHHQSFALGNLTGIFIQLGRLEEANAYNEEDLALNQRLEYPLGMANALWDKARISFFAGKTAEAERLLKEVLTIYYRMGNWNSSLDVMERMALEVKNRGRIEQAVQILGACHAARLQYDVTTHFDQADRVAEFLNESGNRDSLFQQWWEAGQKLSLAEAIELIGEK